MRPLFEPATTHIIVKCWRCKHEVEFRPGEMPNISEADFCKRAKCKVCGARQPEVIRMPKKPSRWLRG